MSKFKTSKNYRTKDYTLTYHTKMIDGKFYAVIDNIKNMSQNFKIDGNLVIPSKIGRLNVHSIGLEAFSRNLYIKNVIIEDGIKEVEHAAFYGCDHLSSITFPKTLISIGSSAFVLCFELENIKLPEGLKIIDSAAFKDSELKEINLPNTLVTIGDGAFMNTKISSIHIGPNINVIGASAFNKCSNLKDVTFSEGVKTIEDYAFKQCYKLESVNLPNSLNCVGYDIFHYCISLKEIQIGSNLLDIPYKQCFGYGCNNLKKIIVSPSHPFLKTVDGALYDRFKKTLIRVPPALKNQNIKIPGWVETLADYCFDNVDFNKLTIKTPHLNNIENCNLINVRKIFCIPNSDAEKEFKLLEVAEIRSDKSTIEDFLNELSNESKNK